MGTEVFNPFHKCAHTSANALFDKSNARGFTSYRLYFDAGIASKDKDIYVLDLSKVGYDKVLAKGKWEIKLKLKARYASKGAVRKIEAAGGEVTLTEVPPVASLAEPQE